MANSAPAPGRSNVPSSGNASVLGFTALAALISGSVLSVLGVSSAITSLLTSVSAVAAAIIALPDKGDSFLRRSRRFYLLFAVAVVVPVLIALSWQRLTALTDLDRVVGYVDSCQQDGFACEIVTKLAAGTGGEEVSVYAVNAKDAERKFDAGSAVVILDRDDRVRWRSEFTPGYGAQSLETDITGNIFATFAVTNHSAVVWVLRLQDKTVQHFGTVGGSLAIDDYGADSDAEAARLFASREGWPANSQNPTTSRDVFKWTGQTYAYSGCEIVQTGETLRVIEEFPPKSARCPGAVGRYAFQLDGQREESQLPP